MDPPDVNLMDQSDVDLLLSLDTIDPTEQVFTPRKPKPKNRHNYICPILLNPPKPKFTILKNPVQFKILYETLKHQHQLRYVKKLIKARRYVFEHSIVYIPPENWPLFESGMKNFSKVVLRLYIYGDVQFIYPDIKGYWWNLDGKRFDYFDLITEIFHKNQPEIDLDILFTAAKEYCGTKIEFDYERVGKNMHCLRFSNDNCTMILRNEKDTWYSYDDSGELNKYTTAELLCMFGSSNFDMLCRRY